ncbi:transcriptional regulator, partial [Cupriavidus sp. UYMMa02A]
MTRTKYQQLQPEERMRIEIWKAENVSQREMARRLGRAPSTLMRELRRNATAHGGYGAITAQARRAQRRQASRPASKLAADSVLWGVVRHFLDQKWSPQEISATLKRAFPDHREHHVSHETIYNAIYAYPRGELRRQLIACLRQGRAKRLPRSRGTDRRGQIPDMVSIHVRPPEINDRLMPGHWEGDLIKGAGNRSAVGVLVERMSRAVLLVKMSDATAASALAGFTAKLQSLVAPLRQTLTYDQGREMVRHAELSAATGVRVYFCDPHSPWQRGTCENTNGLLRQYLP